MKIIFLCITLVLMCGSAAADWNVTWTPVKESIVDKEYIIEVQNMQAVKRDVNISSFFAETNFDISNVKDVKFYEWKDLSYTYTVDHYDEIEYSEYQPENNTWHYWTESVYNYTETIESIKLDWKECKAQLFKETGTTKEDNYGFINIPALGSKPKDDGTYNGTKVFKLTFRTPILYNGGYGSCGKVALLLDAEEHHPYWNTSWSSKQNIILTGDTSGAQTDYQILLNVSWVTGMQIDFDDLRFTNDTHEIDSWLESKVDSSYALVWVEFPTTPANGVNQTYYMYYGNAGIANVWDIDETFIFGDDFPGSSIDAAKWNQDYTGCSSTVDVSGSILTLDCGAGCTGDLQRMLGTLNNFQSDNVALRFKNNANAGGGHRSYTWMENTKPANAVDDTYCTLFSPSTTLPHDIEISSYVSGSSQTKTCCNNVYSQNTWYTFEIQRIGNDYKTLVDEVLKISDTRTGLSTDDMYISLGIWSGGPAHWDWIILMKHVTSPPTVSFTSTIYYVDSIHYNSSHPYNHTIESNGTITANRTIINDDDINWTAAALTDDCHLIVTEYNLTNTTIANFTVSTSILDWLSVSNLIITDSYDLLYNNGTFIERQIANDTGIANFIINLSPNSYIIKNAGLVVKISL